VVIAGEGQITLLVVRYVLPVPISVIMHPAVVKKKNDVRVCRVPYRIEEDVGG
jgi:hypothetical protein